MPSTEGYRPNTRNKAGHPLLSQSCLVGVGHAAVDRDTMKNEMCSHYGEKTEVTDYHNHGKPVVAKKVKCPECGRKVKQRVKPCGCGFEFACWITYSIPPHKVKGWFKKEKTKTKKHKETTGIRKSK